MCYRYSSQLRLALQQVSSKGKGESSMPTLTGLLQQCTAEGHSDAGPVATPRKRRRSEQWIQQVAAYVKVCAYVRLSACVCAFNT